MTITDEAVEAALVALPPSELRAEQMRAALTAALPHLTGGVSVKALPWKENIGENIWTGELIFGAYYTIDRADDFLWEVERCQFLSEGTKDRIGVLPSIEAAKAAAQADYERRILSALTETGAVDPTSPDPQRSDGPAREDGRSAAPAPTFAELCADHMGKPPAVPAPAAMPVKPVAPYLWEGYWPGAGSVGSLTRHTRDQATVDHWLAQGVNVTALYSEADYLASEAARQKAEEERNYAVRAASAFAELDKRISERSAQLARAADPLADPRWLQGGILYRLLETLQTSPTRAFGEAPIIALGHDFAREAAEALAALRAHAGGGE